MAKALDDCDAEAAMLLGVPPPNTEPPPSADGEPNAGAAPKEGELPNAGPAPNAAGAPNPADEMKFHAKVNYCNDIYTGA